MIVCEYMGEELNLIRTRKDALSFRTCFEEFGIGSYISAVTHIYFRYDGYGEKTAVTDDDIGYTIDHEHDGYIGASLSEVVDYIYRNRKHINAWMKDICSGKDMAEHFAIESEMKVIKY